VLVYDQDKATLGVGKFNPLWHGPYIVRHALWKEPTSWRIFEGNALSEPRNGLYLKKYYA
jgi:hypothetical protein